MKVRRFAALLNLGVAAALMLAVWMLLVYAASRPALRKLIDLTPQALNTVSPETEALLRSLAADGVEVEMHLFFPRLSGTPRDPAQQQLMVIRDRLQQATQLLVRRYQTEAGEAMKVFVHDLVNDIARTTEAAQAFDYKGPYDEVVVTVRQKGGERRFRKLSLTADLAEIRLPELQPNAGPGSQLQVPILKRFLGEVALSSAIKSLLVQGTPVAYFLNSCSPDLDFTDEVVGRAYGAFVNALGGLGFETRTLDFSRQRVVPRDAALVVVLEPRYEFTDLDAQALFEYVRRGGRLFVNYTWSPQPDWNPTGGKLAELLGFEVGAAPVFHLIPDYGGVTGGRGLDGDPAVRRLQLLLDAQHPVTRRLAQGGYRMEVVDARPLRPRPAAPAGVEITPLLQTGDFAWIARAGADGRFDYKAPPLRLDHYVVGLAIEVAPEDGTTAPEQRPGEVVVISGTFCNNADLKRFGDLAFNVCNWLAERRVLMNIQSSQYQPAQMQIAPQQVDRVRAFLIYGVPGFLLAAGLVVFFVRRRI